MDKGLSWLKRGNNRQRLLRLLGWLHCALIIGLLYAGVVRIIEGEGALLGAYWRGFLFLVPLVLADLAAERLAALWQFGLASLAVTGLTWLLLGRVWAIVPIALVCFFRARNRLSEEPVDSLLDEPRAPLAFLFLLPFFYSAISGGPLMQKLTLLSAALYLLACLASRGVGRIDGYLELNRDRAGVPVRRIVRTSGLALLLMLVLAAGLVLPALLTDSGYYQIVMGEKKQVEMPQQTIETAGELPSLPEELTAGAGSGFQIPPFVTYLFFALLAGLALAGVLYGVYWLVRNFRGSFTDHRDVVQYLGAEEKRERVEKKKRRGLSGWDRSPNAAVRRRYKRAVLRRVKEPPEQWRSPRELEERAGLSWEELHRLYEKARYSPQGCTAEESRSLKAPKT